MADSGISNKITAILEAEMGDFDKKLELAQKLLGEYGKKVEHVARKLKKSNSATNKYKNDLSKLENQYEQNAKSVDNYSKQHSDLVKKINDSERQSEKLTKELEEMQQESRKAANSIEDLGGEARQYSEAAENTARSTSRMDKGLTRFNHTTGSANNVMMSFGQTIQDAPYGIRGVANNITFLAESFGDMVRQTGSARNAFKSLLSTLTGTTGIILAISVITSLLVSFGDELLDTKTAADEARESYKKAREELDKFIESLNSLDNVKLKTSIDIATEQFKVLDLFQRAKGGEEAAFKQLKEDYPAALKGISDSSELTRESLDKLVQSVIELNNKFKNKEAWDQYKSNLEDIVKFQKQINTLTNKLIPQAKKHDKDFQWEFSEWVDDLKGLFGSGNVDKLVDKLEAAKEAVKRLREENKKLDLTYDFNYGDVPENLSEEEKPVVEARAKITAIEAPQGEVTKLKLDTSLEPVQFNWENVITDSAFDNFMAKLTQAKNLAQVMSNAISSSFSAMASKLSESLGISNDILNAFVSSILQSLAKVASQALAGFITQQLINGLKITAQKQLATASAITSAANAAALIPGGFFALPGMIGTATAQVQSAFSGLQAFAGGGIVSGGSFTGDNVPIMVNSGEMILNNRQQSKLFSMLNGQLSGNNDMPQIKVNVVGRISGENIKLASDRYTRKRNRIG